MPCWPLTRAGGQGGDICGSVAEVLGSIRVQGLPGGLGESSRPPGLWVEAEVSRLTGPLFGGLECVCVCVYVVLAMSCDVHVVVDVLCWDTI